MHRVLIVDDEPLIRRGLIETIDWEELGFEVADEAGNGEVALEMVRKLRPELLITDIKMPIMDGIRLMEAIRKEEHKLRIIVLSGYNDFEFLRKAIQLNVDNYLLKPLKQKELNEVLKMVATHIEEDYMSRRQLYHGLRSLKSNTLNRLIQNNISYSEFKEKRQMCDIQVEDENMTIIVGVTKESVDQLQQFSMVNVCNETFSYGEVFSDERGNVIFIAPDSRIMRENGEQKVIREEILKEIKANVKEYVGIELDFSYKKLQHMKEIADAYHHMVKNQEEGKEKEIQEWHKEGDSVKSNRLVEEILAYCREHHYENLSLKGIAEYFDINASYLGQLIKKSKGISFTEFMNKYRIEKAIEYLKTTNLKVYEIAEEVGYTNYQYFIKMFKKHTGNTPSDYK